MSKFKVGDTVRYVGGGVTGVITECRTSPWSGLHSYLIRHAHDQDQRCIWESELELVPQSQLLPREFKVGDRVMVTGYRDEFWNGTIGVIKCFDLEYFPAKAVIKPENRPGYAELRFEAVHLSKQISLSPQSPQPQTTEPKEDMKPYVVIYHDLHAGTPAQIQSHHTTQEEAKESAELLIAGQRANKRHFAVTIVNTKTGKLVGSVVDAPPAVEWKTE